MYLKNPFILSWLVLFFAGSALQAQDIVVKASVSRDRILIGEQIVFKLEAEAPANSDISWFRVDSIGHFEYVASGPTRDTQLTARTIIIRELHTVTSFDSGSWTIPRYSLSINNNRYLTDSIRVEVGYSAADPSQPYHDIKDIVEVPPAEQLYINYIIAVVTLLAIVLLAWLFMRKKRTGTKAAESAAPRLTPYEKATTELATLRQQGYPAPPQLKPYYTRLNDILRDYVRGRQLITQPDASNEQLVIGVKSLLDNDSVYRLAQSLRLSDAVKFAKYEPSEEEHVQVFTGISDSIGRIEKQITQTPAP